MFMFDFFLPASVWGAFAVLQKVAEYGIASIMLLPVAILDMTKLAQCQTVKPISNGLTSPHFSTVYKPQVQLRLGFRLLAFLPIQL